MLKNILKKILKFKIILKFLLRLDNLLYKLITLSSLEVNNGKHPKHEIIKYENWFLDNIEKNQIVLDIGSNLGKMAYLICKKAKHSFGIELNRQSVEKAIQKYDEPNLEFFHSDAMTFDYSKLGKVSVVTMSNVLEHIEERIKLIKKIVTEIDWDTQPKFLIRVPMIDREWISVYKKQLGIEWRLDNTHFIEYELNSFKEEIATSNLEISSYEIKYGELFAVCRGTYEIDR